MNKYQIKRAAVVGAGTMGAAIAAHLANAGVRTTLLDIVPKDAPAGDRVARNKIVREGWERCLRAKPGNLMSSDLAALVTLGNLEDDLEAIAGADWIIEAVVENLEVKQALITRLDGIRQANAIISTNTSGIPVREIAVGRSENFGRHFLGTHFFNPPRYLKLLELIPTADTSADVIAAISRFAEYRLGKGVVLCKDTPNFIGNRIAFGTGAFALDYVLRNGYTVDEVDAVTGQAMGRPKTATFRLIDLVGVDVWEHVGSNLAPLIQHDELAAAYLRAEAPRELIHTMVERGWLGNKTRIGFYKEVPVDGRKEFWPLDLKTLEHVPPTKPRFESVGKAREAVDLPARLAALLEGGDRGAQLAAALTYQSLQYVSTLLPEIADTPGPIDDAVRWGFQHEAGPFETWDMLGVAETARRMSEAGYPAAPWVEAMLRTGIESFYRYERGQAIEVYDVSRSKYVQVPRAPGMLRLKNQAVISRNAGATLYDAGDGVALVEFHTKMNTLDDDIFSLVSEALDRVEKEFDALVIGNEAENFSAGANLFMVVVAAQQGMWDQLDQAVRKLQNLNMRMRYFPKPIVVAPAGMALGGGCEVAMHASRQVAAAETYIGLVEFGAGVIPAGAGTKEYMRRIINPPMRTENAEALPFVQRAFLQIGQARVATSAEEARQMAILGPQDRVVMNRSQLLTEAKREARYMADSGYHAPAPESIYAAGRDMLGVLRVGAFMFVEGRYISEYDAHLANTLARVICGGDLARPRWVSEQYILDLEREAFLSVCGEEKSQARMWSILQTGKPLRN